LQVQVLPDAPIKLHVSLGFLRLLLFSLLDGRKPRKRESQRVDIPTVSRWLGHKDGGALAMKVYGHVRNQHSASMAKPVNFAPAESNIIPLAEPKADPPKHGSKARNA
jgi:hypothetical protein